jgi:membrane protein YqaA with SNARE-associated domain
MLKKSYTWILEKAGHPYAKWYLAGISFAESSVSPFPPDPLMVPMIIRDKSKAWSVAFNATVSSALGGILGYAIGLFLFEKLGVPILNAYSLQDKFTTFQETFHRWGFLAIMIKAFTPIPFKLVTITCGAVKFNFWLFLLASTLSRGLRFYILAAALKRWGIRINTLMEEHIGLITLMFIGLLVGGFFLVKYI